MKIKQKAPTFGNVDPSPACDDGVTIQFSRRRRILTAHLASDYGALAALGLHHVLPATNLRLLSLPRCIVA